MDADPFVVEHLVEGTRELAIAVMNQWTRAWLAHGASSPGFARLLEHPLPVGPGSGASEVYAAAVELNEEEDVEPAKRDRLDREEVDREHSRRLRTKELTPRYATPFARRAETMIAQNLADCGGRDGRSRYPALRRFVHNPSMASRAQGEEPDLRSRLGSMAGQDCGEGSSASGDQVAVPASNAPASRRRRASTYAGEAGSPRRERSARGRRLGSRNLTAQNVKLTAKHHDLKLLDSS